MTENYKTVKFGDVAKKVNKTVNLETTTLDKYVGGEHMNTDDLRIKEWGVLGDDYLGPAFNKEFKAGQILYGSRRTYLKKVAIPDFDGICSNTTFVIEPTGKDILPELVPFVMHSQAFTDHSIRESKGSTNPYINWKDIAKYEFSVPADMERQREIAEVLCEAESAFIKNSQLLSVAEQYKKIMMNELFHKGIGHNKFKKYSKKQFIPQKWDIKKIKDLFEIKTGSTPSTIIKPYWDKEEIVWITPNDLSQNQFNKFIDNSERKISRKALEECNLNLLPEKSIIISSRAPVGYVSMSSTEACFNQGCKGFLPKEELYAEFYYYYLSANTLQLRAKSCGSTFQEISKESLNNIKIPYPKLNEQKQIATILTQIDEIINSARLNLEYSKALKFRLINEYFPSREEVLS